MKWLWLSLVVAALVGCVKTEAPTSVTPIEPIPGAGGAGGAPAGGGGGAAGGGGDPALKCETIPPTTTPAMLHADASSVLTIPMGSCNFSSCHNPPNPKAMLLLQGVTDLNAQLVGKASCEAPTVPVVAAGGGDTALQNSWLWLKLTAPTDPNDGSIMANPAWGAGGLCGNTATKPFGGIMPYNATTRLSEYRLGKIRRWICGGAPGPL
jgi:hypothetical protein